MAKRRPGRGVKASKRGGKTGLKSRARAGSSSNRSVKRPKAKGATKAAARRKPPASARKKSAPARKSAARPKTRVSAPREARVTAPRKMATSAKRTAVAAPPRGGERPRAKPARLDRARRTLEEVVPSPPSSLDLDRHGSAVRTGRAEMAQSRLNHATMTPAITGGDVDASVENAYFSGDEAPGGDMPSPDQDIVDEIGKAAGVEYQDNEELRASDKVVERDKHRWELDPASSEDYKERK
jgi:hypothetical protein